MRKIIGITICILLIISISGFAQKNALKIGFTDAFLGNFNLSYENALSQKQSLLLKFGYIKPTVSPFIREKAITPSAYTLEETTGGINTSLEYRFYVKADKTMQGFYIAPYLRYINQIMDYSDEIDARIFMVDFRLNTIGTGAQLGYQLLLGETVFLDFYFFGAGIDYHMVHFNYQLKQQESGFNYENIKSEVSDVFKNINYLHEKLKYEVTDDKLTTRLPFLFPGFRIGISIGVAF